jgi:hypothetical protein
MSKEDNQRIYCRTNTILPLQVRRLPPGEGGELRCQVLRNMLVINTSPPPLEDERLNQWLQSLNAKLDYLLSLFVPQREGFVTMTFEPLNISGSGMRVHVRERFTIGEVLEIRLVLETFPSKVLHLFGEVVRVGLAADRTDYYTVGIKFLGVDEEVRKEILKFDFCGHREKVLAAQCLPPRVEP